jgi:hypothetical protein
LQKKGQGGTGLDDAIRGRMKAALQEKRLGLKQASIAAGFGQTYLFDALVGRDDKGARRLGGTRENFEFIAKIIGLNRRWLMDGAGPMWVEDQEQPPEAGPTAADDAADLLAVIEEALSVFLAASPEAAKASARALADLAKNPLRLRAGADRAKAQRRAAPSAPCSPL